MIRIATLFRLPKADREVGVGGGRFGRHFADAVTEDG
jgi:hypothetical protein